MLLHCCLQCLHRGAWGLIAGTPMRIAATDFYQAKMEAFRDAFEGEGTGWLHVTCSSSTVTVPPRPCPEPGASQVLMSEFVRDALRMVRAASSGDELDV